MHLFIPDPFLTPFLTPFLLTPFYSSSGYLRTVRDYVHLDPARAKLLKPEQPLRSYQWSNWPEYF